MAIFTNSPKELILSSLNAGNSPVFPFTKDNVYFGIPKEGSNGLATVAVAGVLGSEYRDYSYVNYRRINLSKAFESIPVVKAVYAPTLYELLESMSTELGLVFLPEDIVNRDISFLNPGEEVNIEFVSKPTSLSYLGKFVVKYQRLRKTLVAALPTTTLNELNHLPTASFEKRSLEMAMYGIDFSADAVNLRLWGNTWWYSDKLKQTALKNGFPNWPTAGYNDCRDSSTKDEPFANKSFDRVVIQKNVSLDNYTGDAYFHYNLT